MSFGLEWYDDVKNQDKTRGLAIAHNAFTTGASLATVALSIAVLGILGGWAILGIAEAATLASKTEDYLYNNSEIVRKSVDWIGDRISDIGQGIKSFFGGSNTAHTKYQSPSFNAP